MRTSTPDQAVLFSSHAPSCGEPGRPALETRESLNASIKLGTAQRLVGDPRYRETLIQAEESAVQIADAELLAEATVANSRGFFSSLGEFDQDRIRLLISPSSTTGVPAPCGRGCL